MSWEIRCEICGCKTINDGTNLCIECFCLMEKKKRAELLRQIEIKQKGYSLTEAEFLKMWGRGNQPK